MKLERLITLYITFIACMSDDVLSMVVKNNEGALVEK